MNPPGVPAGNLDWLVGEFTRQTPGVQHCLVVSADGLLLACSGGVGDGLADQLSAATSGLMSLSRGAAALLEQAPVSQMIVEMSGGYLFATSISEGATLAVVARRQCDMGMIGYEMTLLASRVGHALSPAARHNQAGMQP